MKIDKYRTFAKEVSLNNSELFSYEKKCIDLANSTINLYALNSKLAQNTNLGGWF